VAQSGWFGRLLVSFHPALVGNCWAGLDVFRFSIGPFCFFRVPPLLHTSQHSWKILLGLSRMLVRRSYIAKFFSFVLHFFHINFAKIYGPQKNSQNYTSGAVGDGGRDLPPWGARYCSGFLPLWGTAVGSSLFLKKIVIFFVWTRVEINFIWKS
jgi:hypothetical protein